MRANPGRRLGDLPGAGMKVSMICEQDLGGTAPRPHPQSLAAGAGTGTRAQFRDGQQVDPRFHHRRVRRARERRRPTPRPVKLPHGAMAKTAAKTARDAHQG
jgi:hypothetical protein